jgi:hypothetical protein
VQLIRSSGSFVLVLTLLGGAAAAQPTNTTSNVSSADIQRLQDNIYTTARDVADVRRRDATLAAQLEAELDEARDEAIYLKVKVRKNEPIARNEYSDVLDRIDSIRTRARREAPSQAAAPSNNPARRPAPVGTVGASDPDADLPVGTELDVRLQDTLSSATTQVEDRFEATTLVDVRDGDRVLVPAGSVVRGVVSSVTKAGRIERQGKMTVAFDQITVDGRTYPIRATVTGALESEGVRGEAARIGAGAGVGAIIGGILGGFKGALAGILIGGGGTIAATEGTDVELPAGTVLRLRMDTGLDLRRR